VSRDLGVFEQRLLLFSVFILSLCGIIYELVLGSLATYLFGNPVKQYSITIGFFLFSMGLGSYLSRYFVKDLLRNFIFIEVTLGLVGGVSVAVLTWLFSFELSYYLLHIFFLVLVGMLVGLEIPLITRIMKQYGSLKDILSNVLSLDYIGGLAGSLFFPLVLFPYAGRFLTSILVGAANVAVALIIMAAVKYPGKRRWDFTYPVAAVILLAVMAVFSDQMSGLLNRKLYFDDVVFSKRSDFQEIVLTRNSDDFRLYLDGSLQFSTQDEYRYHEMLVYPALFLCPADRQDVLVMGGGDGLAVRDVLKSPRVSRVILVELDPMMVRLAKENSSFRRINGDSLKDPRVTVVEGDAFAYLTGDPGRFHVIIADFPDPHDETISKLYSVEFFRMVKRALAPTGVFVTQSTSPLFAREAFWCIYSTVREVFGGAVPYHVYVPSFGDWGFVMASPRELRETPEPPGTMKFRYFSREAYKQARYFPADSTVTESRTNTFNRPVLYTYYLRAWKQMDY
jgi:spermidine synthase